MCLFLLWGGSSVCAQSFFPDSVSKATIDSLMYEVSKLSQIQRDSLKIALMESFSLEELMAAEKIQDSLFGQGADFGDGQKGERKDLFIPPDRIKNSLLSRPIGEIPGNSLYLSIPDSWKELDPFANQSMMPKLPKRYPAHVPDYARFTVGIDGYYFAFQEIGYFGWSRVAEQRDSLFTKQNIDFTLHIEQSKIQPNLLRTLNRSKNALVVLAIILQILL